ncbi:MAG TPA: alkaline phosphatase family protein, partial [Terriglobales bacterium]
MLTGLTPAENGMWNLVYYDPQNSPFKWMKHLGTAAGRAFDNRIGRRLLTEVGRRVLGVGDNFDVSVPPATLPWFHWVENRNIYARNGVRGHSSIFDLLDQHEIKHKIYSYKESLSDREIMLRAESDIANGNEEFYFLYLCELDMFLHTHRSNPREVEAKLSWYEDGLRRLYTAARQRDAEANFHIFSDHGMTPVQRHCDLAGAVKAYGFKSPQDYLV